MQHYYLKGIQGFGATYGCSAYGTGGYTQSTACGTGSTANSGSNLLVNTGIAISLIVGLAALLLLAALLVRFWRRPARPVLEQVPIEDTPEPQDSGTPRPPLE
jgi:hypothetical protein